MYFTVTEMHIEDARRHLGNSLRYARIGQHVYAFNSYRKALKNYKKAEDLQKFLGGVVDSICMSTAE